MQVPFPVLCALSSHLVLIFVSAKILTDGFVDCIVILFFPSLYFEGLQSFLQTNFSNPLSTEFLGLMQIASTHLDLCLGSSMFLMPIVLQALHIIRCPAQCTRVVEFPL